MPVPAMSDPAAGALNRLLASCVGGPHARRLLATIDVHPPLLAEPGEAVSRAVLAQALTMILFDDLLERVPSGRAYVSSVLAEGRKVTFDHGALRTVKGPRTGALPAGNEAFARILEPLGYGVAAVHPLDRIAMTGRAYTHRDLPQQIPQFFVSELHPERFSPGFQKAVDRVLESSRDPVTPVAATLLAELGTEGALALPEAARLLAVIGGAFARQHDTPRLDDYEILLAESPAMAWIATEGNTFNHATDRVADVVALAEAYRDKEVAEKKLEAARDQAEAMLAKAAAEAAVIGFANEADAAGWKKAVEALGNDGEAYARYVLYQKLAPGYRSIMVNTADSPLMEIFRTFAKPGTSGKTDPAAAKK